MAVTKAKVRRLALALGGAREVVHVDRPAFRTVRKIFATLPPNEERVNLMFDAATQDFFCEQAPGVIAPIPRRLGPHGDDVLRSEARRRSARAFRAESGARTRVAQAESRQEEGCVEEGAKARPQAGLVRFGVATERGMLGHNSRAQREAVITNLWARFCAGP